MGERFELIVAQVKAARLRAEVLWREAVARRAEERAGEARGRHAAALAEIERLKRQG